MLTDVEAGKMAALLAAQTSRLRERGWWPKGVDDDLVDDLFLLAKLLEPEPEQKLKVSTWKSSN